jgi:hypothetical protein
MELVRNIFFNTDKLVQDETVKISYTGDLFQHDCENAFLHFAFGNDWSQNQDLPMKKTLLGFQAEFKLPAGARDLQLSFRDDEGNWDNNSKKNYSFEISPRPFALMVIDQQDLVYETPLSSAQLWIKSLFMKIKKVAKYLPRILGFGYESEMNEN